MSTFTQWEPPALIERGDLLRTSGTVLARPDLDVTEAEDIFRIEAGGLEWDIGVAVYTPDRDGDISLGADGKKIGIFLLHGGDGDFKSMAPIAKLYSGKFGHKVVAMTFPGRLYLDHPCRDWSGDTILPDGTVRMPMWKRGETIGLDQYDVVKDISLRRRYGTRVVARAKPDTPFWYRMAAWPLAMEEGMKEAMRRHFPAASYSIYGSGHSTGGPITFMISQRVENFAGVIAAEHSPFGVIQAAQHDWSGALGKVAGFDRVTTQPAPRTDPFNELYIRSWRDCARYAGPEALGREGPSALMRLPSLMEEILDWWDEEKKRPQFKAEYLITHDIAASLGEGARVTARRLGLDPAATELLVAHYQGLSRPLTGPDARPVPNVLFIISKDSRDHSPEVYREVILPAFARIAPAPKVRVTQMLASTHFYMRPEEGLPAGIAPNIAQLFHDAITSGYFAKTR